MKKFELWTKSWAIMDTEYLKPQERMALLMLCRAAGFTIGEGTSDEYDEDYPYIGFDVKCSDPLEDEYIITEFAATEISGEKIQKVCFSRITEELTKYIEEGL